MSTGASDRNPGQDPFLRRVSILGAAGAILIALLGLLGYVPGLQFLGRLHESFIPMAPSTAISFILLGSTLLALTPQSLPRAIPVLLAAVALLATIFGALEVAGHFSGTDLDFEDVLVPSAGYLGEIPIARMSPATGATFVIGGLATLALVVRSTARGRRAHLEHWAGCLGSVVLAVAIVFSLAYLFGTPLLYGAGVTVPMALTTSFGFLMLGIATLGNAGWDAIPVKLLAGRSTRSTLLRVFVPLNILSALLGGFLVVRASLSSELNPALLAATTAVVTACITGLVTIWIARHVASSIARSELVRDQALSSLRESEERYRNFVANATEGIYRIDFPTPIEIDVPDEELVANISGHAVVGEVNEALARMHGLHPKDMVGRLATDFAPEYGARALIAVRAHLHQVHDVETRDLDQDGQTILLSESYSAVLEDGFLARIWGVQRDITERKRIEEEKSRLQEQLHQAQKMEAIGRLAGGVAHDFNNVLCAIMGNTDLALSDMSIGDPQRASLVQIAAAAQRAADLTRQLLAFSRKQIIEPKVVNLSQLIENLRPMLVRLIGEDIILRTVPQDPLGSVRVDPGQLEQIVLNLAINARDAMPDGGELLIESTEVMLDDYYCQLHADAATGAYVMLTASDTGCGMSAEIREKIFEPFFTTKQLGQGTGLGLATIFGIVEQSNGRIEVYSEPGKGSTFKLYFPRVDAEAETVAHSEPVTPIGGHETVLVVEDEEMVRNLAVKLLSRLGYQVLAADSGRDALAMVERLEGPIDLLLTDVVMPHMNGRELAAKLAEIRPGLEVLYTSGYTQNVIAHHGILDEGLQFIAKPYSHVSLAARVREVLDQAGEEEE